jgi:hypothetical protein
MHEAARRSATSAPRSIFFVARTTPTGREPGLLRSSVRVERLFFLNRRSHRINFCAEENEAARAGGRMQGEALEALDPVRLGPRGAFCPEGLLLLPDGRLVRRRFGAEPVHRDVTDKAYEFLFEYLYFCEGATLRSMFDLLARCPPLQVLYRRRYARELLAEALSAAEPAESPDPRREVEPDALECLAFQYWASRNLDARLLSDYSSMCLIGLGPVALQEIVEHGERVCAAGDRRRHALSHLSCRDLIDVPLGSSREVRLSIRESLHPDDTPSWERVERWDCAEGALVTLGNALQTMLHHFSSGSTDYPLADPAPSKPMAANDDLLPVQRPAGIATTAKTTQRPRGGTVRRSSGETAN